MAMSVRDATGTAVTVKTTVALGEHTAHTVVDSLPAPSAIINSQVNTSAANPQQLPANAIAAAVSVKALPGNGGLVYLGGAGVSASNGWELAAGAELTNIKIDNTNALWVFAASTPDGVAFLGG